LLMAVRAIADMRLDDGHVEGRQSPKGAKRHARSLAALCLIGL